MQSIMNIVICASDNYTMPCGVLLCSICENNCGEYIHFFIFVDDDFQAENKKKLMDLISLYKDKSIEFITVSDYYINKFLPFESQLYTRHVFYRLLMAELLPEDVDKAIYLDCDIIVRQNISSLWNIDIAEYAIGAVHDAQEGKIEQFIRLGYSYDKGYFNSGVLLVNLSYWRKNHSTSSLFSFIEHNPDKIVLPDQDTLNVVFQDVKFFIPITYNLQSDFLVKKKNMLFDYHKYSEELEKCRENPTILHLSGERPWLKGCKHPYKSEYFKYRSKTIWHDEPLWKRTVSLKERLFRSNFVRKPLSKFGLCSVLKDCYDRNLKLKS